MSDSTTFEVKVPAAKLTAFGAELAAHVESVGCSQEPEGRATPAEVVVSLLRELASGAKGEECLTLAFPADQALREFHAENPEVMSAHPGKVAVGCFWVQAKLGEGSYIVSFTSATRSISSLMKESSSLRATFRALAQDTTDGTVQVTNEWHEASVL